MLHRSFSTRVSRILLGIILFFAAGICFPAQRQSRRKPDPARNLSRMMIPGTQDLQLIVELSDPSVLEGLQVASAQQAGMAGKLGSRSRPNLASAEALGYRGQISRAQESLKKRVLEFPGARVLATVDTVMNAVIVRVPAAQYQAIRGLPGIKKVYFSRPVTMLLDKAAIIQNAQAMWTQAGGRGNAGKGIKIGIIDSGIDIENPMFSPAGFTMPAGYPKYDSAEDQTLTNAKVIVARSYASRFRYSQAIQSAVDEVGHGTFVAGTAAGVAVDAPLASISGMAPGAFLGSYKVFGTPGTNDGATEDSVIAALDDAVKDGMDVINLSLGALNYLPSEENPTSAAINRALQADVAFTIAAGNSGPSMHSISDMGSFTDAVTVGSVTNSRAYLPAIHLKNSLLEPIGYAPSSDGPQVVSDVPYTKVVDVASLGGDGLGCSAFAGSSLSSSIALIGRGTCSFSTKVSFAFQAGATAVIIYNNVPYSLDTMAQLSGTSIPAILISMGDGAAIRQYIAANPSTAQVSIGSYTKLQWVSATAKVLSSFSSVGPGTDFNLKPDLLAVGENVYSATEKTYTSGPMYDASGFTISQGTSFSAPMAAGAAAALRAHFPSLGVQAIKSLLTTTASRDVTVDGTRAPDVMQGGAGLLNMGNAISATAVFAPTSLNFGVHSYSGTLDLSADLTIQNISSNPDEYTVDVEPIVSGPVITLSETSTGSIGPSARKTINISLQAAAPQTGGFQGFITVTSKSSSFTYRIPYWAGIYVPDSTRVLPVSQSDTAAYQTVEAAIAAARPGNIIEIQDNASYSGSESGLVITTNSEGLPLHGLTIRAAAGKNPILKAVNTAIAVQIVGLNNVLLQRLNIQGGLAGIELFQPSVSVPLSVTIDQCNIGMNNTGYVGIFVAGGGTVDITRSTIINALGPGILVDGAQLTMVRSTVQGNGDSGVVLYGANVQISDSTFTSNRGNGVQLHACTGAVTGNTFSSNITSYDYGAGLVILDGKITVRKNIFYSNADAGIILDSEQTVSGPTARIESNTLRRNGWYGIDSEGAGSVTLDANLVEDNFGGVYLYRTVDALLTNDIVVRSTDRYYGYGSGVDVDSGTNARLINNTIYGNGVYGVALWGGTVSISNSIVLSNGSGNFRNGGAGILMQSSLTNGEDPKFVNPVADDFSLQPGSPAIDKGSNSVALLPYLDFAGRSRIASGTVDIGALEVNSTYPLVYPVAVNGTPSDLGGSFTTGIAFINPNASAADLTFTGYDLSGSLSAGTKNPAIRHLDAQAQLAILKYELLGADPDASSIGSVIGASTAQTAGFMLVCDPEFRKFSTGANASTRLSSDLVFMRHESGAGALASYVVANPGNNTASITATLYNSNGAAVGVPQTAAIVPKASTVLHFDSSGVSSGYVKVRSDQPVAGVELIGNEDVMSALGGFSPGTNARLLFPHFAVGGNYSTRVGIINTNSSTVSVSPFPTLVAYDDDGNFIGRVIVPDLGLSGRLLIKTITELFGIPTDGPLRTGYLVAESTQPGMMGYTNFRYNDGVVTSDANIPADSAPNRRLLFSHIAQGVSAGNGVPYNTGIALLNPFGTTVSYTISIYDGSGKLVATADQTIPPHKKVAKILTYPEEGIGFFSEDLILGNGHVEVTSDYGLIGLELFFTEDLSQLASVPSQVGD
jgi:minor extracellular serine protease Vpr